MGWTEVWTGVLNVHISMRLVIQKDVLETILHLVFSPKHFCKQTLGIAEGAIKNVNHTICTIASINISEV